MLRPVHLLMRKNHGISTKPDVIKRLSIGRDEWYTKRKGEIAELIFVIKASSMGFAVSKPYGDSEAYDLVIEDEWEIAAHSGEVGFHYFAMGI